MTQKILVMLPNNLGDVIMALPVLEGLKHHHHNCHITFFVEQGYEGGLVNSPFCDSIYRFNRAAIRDGSRSDDWQEAVAMVADAASALRQEHYNRIINLSQHAYAPYLVSLLSCRNVVGREFLRDGNQAIHDLWSQYLYAIPYGRRFNHLHATDVYRFIAGVGGQPSAGGLTVTAEERTRVNETMAALGWSANSKPIMVLQPGAAFEAKRWPLEHFAALGTKLIEDGYTLLITGAPAESELAGSLAAQLGNSAFSTAGKITFRETISLLPRCAGCVTGDTAIMHAAAALKCKVYALFGPTNPVETGPYGEGHIVICGRCSKRPCFCFNCKTKLCMKSILPLDVYACIKRGRIGMSASDIYITSARPDGTWLLNSVLEKGSPFFNAMGAQITRRFADPLFIPVIHHRDPGWEQVVSETGALAAALDSMVDALKTYLSGRDIQAIRAFESGRAQLAGFKEIGAFWSAILNLRLNSISLLDPLAGVRKSLDVCIAMKKELLLAVSDAE